MLNVVVKTKVQVMIKVFFIQKKSSVCGFLVWKLLKFQENVITSMKEMITQVVDL